MAVRLSDIRASTGEATAVGSVITVPHDDPVPGYLECDYAEYSRVTYARLFAKIGTKYGDGDGSTTFNVPKYNGLFLRCVDNGEGVDPDAATRGDRGDGVGGDVVGSIQDDEAKEHTHTAQNEGAHTHTIPNHVHDMRHVHAVLDASQSIVGRWLAANSSISTNSTTVGGVEGIIAQADNIAASGSAVDVYAPTSYTLGQRYSSGVVSAPSGSGNSAKTGNQENVSGTQSTSTETDHTHVIDNYGGSESRPKNAYVRYLIKA